MISIVSSLDEELKPGDIIELTWRGKQKTATLVAHARTHSSEAKNQDANKTKKEEPPTKHYVDIMSTMSASFANIFKLIKKLKERNATNPKTSSDKPLQAAEVARETQEDDQKYTEELDRSDDNVLTTKTSNFIEKYEQVEDEWIPIGSGKTYVHKDCFKKEKWRSYRLATRALLIGVFPRSVLATSSMTGKKPPAFKNRPAKMCLDPKKLSDIVIEVTKHFNVSESAVRKVITNKCSDETKWLKTPKKPQKKKLQKNKKQKKCKNDENEPPTSSVNEE
ncbi:hypothetical protein PYW08_005139 [Mythimna loreyi]|uniref:Uncharacterized protein n=1 Tax=Mythimna loreyi TaxID=667449 RepID=A0ACC2QE57_9NEOP|nr:hypothetical protein PYW08_005139 [Mythimna loreyi]